MRVALNTILGTTVYCITVLEDGHTHEGSIFYEDSLYECTLIVSFTLQNHVVILFWTLSLC